MATSLTGVFWSYAHQDDNASRGRLLRLAENLRSELALLSTEPPNIFIDRDSLQWGDRWRQVIDIGLDEAALLVAVITPNYFTRKECRSELLTFLAKEGTPTSGELLLPILFAPIPDLASDNPDGAIAAVASRQFEDWTRLRLAGEDSVEYGKSIDRLALRVLHLVGTMEAARLVKEIRLQDEDPQTVQQDEGELGDLLLRADELWPAWLEAVQDDELVGVSARAAMQAYSARRARLRAAKRPQSQIIATYRDQGARALESAKRHLENAQTYSARTLELDPVVRAAVKAAADRPALTPLLVELREKIDDAVRVISDTERLQREGWIGAEEYVSHLPYVDQTWKQVSALSEDFAALVVEANGLVMRWAADIEDVVRRAMETQVGESADRSPAP